MSLRYPTLFSPQRLGAIEVKNRVVFSAHLTNFAYDGCPSAAHQAYYARRAQGGTGLIITEELSVSPNDWPYEKMIHGFHGRVVEQYRAITSAVHRFDTPIFAQLNHNGAQGSSRYSRLPLWGPSEVRDPLFQELPQAVTEREISEIVEAYAQSAKFAIAGGFDGLELQCSHSSIVRQFLSPLTNKRTDRYGGSLENRTRLVLEIVRGIRECVGTTPVVGVRLCGDEMIDGGITIDETVEVARSLEQSGLIDYFNTSIGVATSTLYVIEASMEISPNYQRFIPATLRQHVRLPVIGSGRVKDPSQAERALRQGHMDLVGIVRGQIADPDFANKASLDTEDDLRLCLSCNQECVGRMGLNRWLSCIENPDSGREYVTRIPQGTLPVRFPQAPPQRSAPRYPSKQRALVIGGGPGGLQSAISLAKSNFAVDLVEASETLGGMVATAARIPSRAEFGDLIRNLQREITQHAIHVHLNVSATAEEAKGFDPAVVVVATGSQPRLPYWCSSYHAAPNTQGATIIDLLAAIARPDLIGKSVTIFDEVGGHPATSVALYLAERAHQVTIVTPQLVVGGYLGVTLDHEIWNLRANELGITQRPELLITQVTGHDVSLLNHITNQTSTLTTDTLIVASHPRVNDSIYHELKPSLGSRVITVGDARSPRRAHAAIIDGTRVGELMAGRVSVA